MPKLDRLCALSTSSLCSTARVINIREDHTHAESASSGRLKWTYEGRLPAKGNVQELWKEAKENKRNFRIETDDFGPSDCSWKIASEATFFGAEPPKQVAIWSVPTANAANCIGNRVYRIKRIVIRDSSKILATAGAPDEVWSVFIGTEMGFPNKLTVQAFEELLQFNTYFTCTATLAIDTTPQGAHPCDPFPPMQNYLFNNKLSDIELHINFPKHQPVTIPAHRVVLATSSEFFRSQFDFEANAGSTTPSHCNIGTFNEFSVRVMLEFMYTRKINFPPGTVTDLLQLIALCDFYQVKGMHEFVAKHILQRMTANNVTKIMVTGHKFRGLSDLLARKAGSYLMANWTDLMANEAFRKTLVEEDIRAERTKPLKYLETVLSTVQPPFELSIMDELANILGAVNLGEFYPAIAAAGWTAADIMMAEGSDLVPHILNQPQYRRLQNFLKGKPYAEAPSVKLMTVTIRNNKVDISDRTTPIPIPRNTFTGFTHYGVFHRECYDDIFQLMSAEWDEGTRNFLILGTPGIGKTSCIPMFLIAFGMKGFNVYLERENYSGLFFTTNGSVHFGDLKVELLPPNTVYLMDSKVPQGTSNAQTTILVSSFCRSKWYSFLKTQPKPSLFIMPRWTWGELKSWNDVIQARSEDSLYELYEMFGGIASHVFGGVLNDDPETLIQQALSRSPLKKIYAQLGAMTWTDEVSDVLLHAVISGKNYRAFRLRFASKYMANVAYCQYWEQHVTRLYWYLNVTDKKAIGLRGQLFEPLAHQELTTQKKTWNVLRLMKSGGEDEVGNINEEDLDWEDADSEVMDVDDSEDDMVDVGSSQSSTSFKQHSATSNYQVHDFKRVQELPQQWDWISQHYCRPQSRIFGSIDAFFGSSADGQQTIVLLQMTVTENHPVMLKGIKAIMAHFGSSYTYKLVFVVPDNIVKDFQYQNYLMNARKVAKRVPRQIADMEQYVLGLP
ncbi:hypothetical protein HK097_008327 [Rhizophlyctis rosea]|uniref:BTB domain-containing protein n=1 Tax=Rhizophlyctis rosea TaxID=64517 RepID=A0AAD5SAH6_9FUNG|nr:hypothetical protein HK097_008327 [Rhizophlyctis rosea]